MTILSKNRSVPALLFVSLLSSYPYVADASTVCAAGCNYGSISAAVAAAAPGDTITLTDSLYNESGIVIDKDLTIRGNVGVLQRATIDAGGAGRIFHIRGAANSVILSKLSLINGDAAGARGGAMWVESGTVSARYLKFRNNIAGEGGAVALDSGTRLITLLNQFAENSASEGGAVYMENAAGFLSIKTRFDQNSSRKGGALYAHNSPLAVVETTFAKNNSNSGLPDSGGAIYAFGARPVVISFSTFRANSASGGGSGGALALENSGWPGGAGIAGYIWNSTFSRNEAVFGGAIHSMANNNVQINNVTFFENTTNGGVAGTLAGGFEVNNSILVNAPPIGPFPVAPCDGFGNITSAVGGNLFENPSATCGLPNLPVTNIDSNLTITGGVFRTATHALLSGSNAIDNGAANCPSPVTGAPLVRDQRMRVRPNGAGCDTGAYEYY
ncbi:MAG TPA: hypothetical protein ENK38_01350 [Gammaproteobacteria bacterium]|nr:hypothetical protein [Gammaproteobacteria bacterium]